MAIDVFELVHGLPVAAVPEPASVMVEPTQTLAGPLITGVGLTGMVADALVTPHSFVTARPMLNVPVVE